MFNQKKESTHSYCKIEIVSLIVYLIAIFWGLAMLYRSVLLSEITRERVVDSLLSVVSLMFILLLHKFNDNLQSTIGKKYCCLVQAFLYFCAIMQGDKYTICLMLIIYLSTILYKPNLDYIIRGILGLGVLLECSSIWFIVQELPELNIIDRILNGYVLDIAFVLVVIIYLLRDKLHNILNRIANCAIYRILVSGLMIVVVLVCEWMMQDAGQWEYLALIAQEHPKKVVTILIITTIYMMGLWRLNKAITVRAFNKYCVYVVICALAGVLCIGLSYWEKTFINQYALEKGYSCQYDVKDYSNGNIELQNFELKEDGTLVSQNDDPWIIIKRKEGFDRTIYNVVLEFEQLTNEGESNIYFVFDDENDWEAGSQKGSYICKKGRVVIEGEPLKSVQNYIRFDLTQQQGVEMKLSSITFNDISENVGAIKYVGVVLVGFSVILAGYTLIVRGKLKSKRS